MIQGPQIICGPQNFHPTLHQQPFRDPKGVILGELPSLFFHGVPPFFGFYPYLQMRVELCDNSGEMLEPVSLNANPNQNLEYASSPLGASVLCFLPSKQRPQI